MKMNNKGFTLIELLAVIVILAIIALIATPIIMGIIDEAKTQSAKNSAYGYLDSVDKAVVKTSFDKLSDSSTVTIDVLDGSYTISDGGRTLSDGTDTITISFKGEGPEDGGILCYDNGKIKAASKITVNDIDFYTDANGDLSQTVPSALCNASTGSTNNNNGGA